MRLGLGSYACAWEVGVPGHPPARALGCEGLVARAAELGLGLVQLADNAPVEGLDAAGAGALRKVAERAGVTLELGLRGLTSARLERHLALCGALGATLLRAVVDGPGFEPSAGELGAILRGHVPALERAGVTLAIENHDRFRAAELGAAVRAAESPRVGVCLDTVNSFGALEGPAVVVEALGPLAVSLHLKDFTVRRAGHGMGFAVEGAPAGEGRLDVPWLLARLRAMGRDPNAILELWVAPEASVEATVAKERRWAQRSVGYLRRLIPERARA